MPVKKQGIGQTQTKVISFRIASDLHRQLEEQAKNLRDETGIPLNASGLARRLVIAKLTSVTNGKKD